MMNGMMVMVVVMVTDVNDLLKECRYCHHRLNPGFQHVYTAMLRGCSKANLLAH